MKTGFLIFALLFIAFACSKDENEKIPQLIEITPEINRKVPVIMDSVLSEFSVLRLVTPKGVLIGSIDKVVCSKNRIYISDNRMMNSVYIFNRFGLYINHIVGGFKGPGEFIRPQSITCDYESDELVVFDDKLKKVVSYDPNGIFISEHKFKYTANDFSRVTDNMYSFNAGFPQIENNVNSFDLLYVSDKGKVLDKHLPLKSWRNGSIFNKENSFSENQEMVWYCPVYNDTIYQITEGGPIPYFHVNMGRKFITDELARKINIDDPDMEYQHAIYKFHKAGRTIYLGFDYPDPESQRNVIMHVFFDLESRKTKTGQFLSGPGISTGLFTGPISSDGDYFIGVVEAFNFKRSLEFSIQVGRTIPEERMALFSTISENDNPLLLFYKVAPF